MAAIRFDSGQKPPQRVNSFQKMLDLEKRFQLARLQSAQAPPRHESNLIRVQIKSPPIQARRQDSKDAMPQQQTGASNLKTSKKPPQLPALSITIPPTRGAVHRSGVAMAAEPDKLPGNLEGRVEDDDATPREKTVTFPDSVGNGEEEEEDSDDSQSDQSSICQSPSWEGWDQTKKNKKKKQERKKEKQKAELELKGGAKKRTTNRLSKAPPPPADLLRPSTAKERPSSSTSARPDSNSSSKTTGKSRKHDATAPEVWDLPNGHSYSASRPLPVNSQSTPALPSLAHFAALDLTRAALGEPERGRQERPSTSREGENEARPHSQGQGRRDEPKVAPAVLAPIAANIAAHPPTPPNHEKMSYPPPSSRSHALKHALPGSNARRNSASKLEEAAKFFKSQNMKSTLGSDLHQNGGLSGNPHNASPATNDRGRQGVNSSCTSSYVRKSRAQSIERSIRGFMEETVLSRKVKQAGVYDQQQPAQKRSSSSQRPSSSQSRLSFFSRTRTDLSSRENSPSSAAKADSQSPKQQQQQQQQNSQENNGNHATPHASSASPNIDNKNNDSENGVNSASKDTSVPYLELIPPATKGIFSNIKSRMRRQSSISSGSSSTAGSAGDKTRDTVNPPDSLATPIATDTQSQKQRPNTSHAALVVPQGKKEPARLPKVARILAEFHSETVAGKTSQTTSRPSEGSSTSSYREDSSMPPSPASSPDTSRPQSVKGPNVSHDEVRKGSPNVHSLNADDATTSRSLPKHQATSVEGNSASRDRSQDRLVSRDTPNVEIKRPSSSGRLLESAERPGSRGRFLEEVLQPMHDANNNSKASLSEGLGALNEAWNQKKSGPADADTRSFVTTVTNQDSQVELAQDDTKAASDANGHSRDGSGPSSKQPFHDVAEMPSSVSTSRKTSQEQPDRPRPNTHRKKEKRAPLTTHMSIVREESKHLEGAREIPQVDQPVMPTDAQKSASHANNLSSHGQDANVSYKPNGPSAPFAMSASSSSGRSSPSAMYLQEARRSAPMISSPLTNVIRSAKANMSTPSLHSAPRPDLKTSTSFSSTQSSQALVSSRSSSAPHARLPAYDPEKMSRPIAKMLVECCHCKYFHDMPSRVYECMAQPDAMVTDRELGVSAAITTMVKCPWCSHNMSTKCCAGYAAVVYLKERLH